MPSKVGYDFVEDLRGVINGFYDEKNRAFRSELHANARFNTNDWNRVSMSKMPVLKRFVQLIMFTDYIKDNNVKVYLSNYGKAYNEVASGLKVSPEALRKRVFYYCSVSTTPGKIVKDFGDTFMRDLIFYSNHDISEFEKTLNDKLIKYGCVKDLQGQLIIDIPRIKYKKEITDSEFDNLLEVITPYMKSTINSLKDKLTDEQCAYFWYMVNNQFCLPLTDAKRFKVLCACMGIEDGAESVDESTADEVVDIAPEPVPEPAPEPAPKSSIKDGLSELDFTPTRICYAFDNVSVDDNTEIDLGDDIIE